MVAQKLFGNAPAVGESIRIKGMSFEVVGVSHYAEMVREARRQRRLVDGGLTDWVIVRNRLSTLGSRNKRLVGEGVNQLARQLGFRSTGRTRPRFTSGM